MNRKGIALIVVLGFMLVIIISITTFMITSGTEIKITRRQKKYF